MRYDYAGFWRRLCSTLIDLPWLLLPFLAYLYEAQDPLGDWTALSWAELSLNPSQIQWLIVVIGIPFLLIILFWLRWAATPGKLLFDCDIIEIRTGRPVTLLRTLLRCWGYVLSFIPFGLGFLWILWDKRKQGWHDKIAGTIVVIHDESSVPIEQLLKGN